MRPGTSLTSAPGRGRERMARRTPAYFITKKWNHDPKSTARCRKALGLLDRAEWFLRLNAGSDPTPLYYDPNFDATPATEDAIKLLENLGKIVAAENDARQKEAAAKER